MTLCLRVTNNQSGSGEPPRLTVTFLTVIDDHMVQKISALAFGIHTSLIFALTEVLIETRNYNWTRLVFLVMYMFVVIVMYKNVNSR